MKRQKLIGFVTGFLFLFTFFNIYGKSDVVTKQTSRSLSSSWVTCFEEDKEGYMWIGTYRGLDRYNGYDYKQYFSAKGDSTTLSFDYIFSLFCDSQGRMWVGTATGMNRYTRQDDFVTVKMPEKYPNASKIFENSKGDIFACSYNVLMKYDPQSEEMKVIYEGYISGAVMDRQDRIWLFSSEKGSCFNENGVLITELVVDSGGQIYDAVLDKNGTIIISTAKGLCRMAPSSFTFDDFSREVKIHPVLSKSMIYKVCPHGNSYLLFTYTDGAFLYRPMDGSILHQSDANFPFDMPRMDVTVAYSDSNQNLWIGSKESGYVVDYSFQRTFNKGRFLWRTLEGKAVSSVVTFGKNIYIATRKDGLYVFDTSIGKVEQMTINMSGHRFVSLDNIFVDSDGMFWIIGDKQLFKFRLDGKDLMLLRDYRLPVGVTSIMQDSRGTLWLGTYSQYMLYLEKGQTDFGGVQVSYPVDYNFVAHAIQLSNGEIAVASLNRNVVLLNPVDRSIVNEIKVLEAIGERFLIPIQLLEDSAGMLWIATNNIGIIRYSLRSGEFDMLDVSDGLACNSVTSMIEDAKGDVWVSTLAGLSKYDRTTGGFHSWFESDGTGGDEYIEKSATLTTNKLLMFGRINGITYFDPIRVSLNKTYSLRFEDFIVRTGRRVSDEGSVPYASKYVMYNPDFVLKYDENNIGISYAAVHFGASSYIRYSYKMEGLDKDWIRAGSNRQANYSELPAGKYVFKVKVDNPDNEVDGDEIALNIRVLQPWWLSWWAVAVYVMAGFAIFMTFMRYYTLRIRAKEELEQVKREKDQEKKIGDTNMEFFTNISHEFRTPLTMISGPVAQMQKKEGLDDESRHLLAIVQRSVNRMLLLIDQILDFRKMEGGIMKLRVEKGDIVAELSKIVEVFAVNASEKGVSLIKKGMIDSYVTWVDVDRLNKIMSNLLSNAFKFTPTGGEICVSLEIIGKDQCRSYFPKDNVKDISTDYVSVAVEDTGCGMSQSALNQAFKRYFVQDDERKEFKNWSSGVGLYYTYKLLMYHHGFISIGNRPSGGTIARFAIPTSEVFYSDDEKVVDASKADLLMKDKLQELQAQDSSGLIPEDGDADSRPVVLVVDDDTEICYYLKLVMSKEYNVVIKNSADAAYADMENIYPSIIVSDVLMPGMDGFEFCKKIKENDSYSHVPVILLTAKAAVDNQITGLQIGADAYVTKPFDPDYLMALIGSQLSNRGKLQLFFKEHTTTEEVEPTSLSSMDKQFMDSLYTIMEKELSNPEINITQISQDMHLSRTKLYYKIKGLTGENPNNFFRCYKLNRAAELLKNGEYNISEVADMTGFKAVSHFSTVFKKQFGVAPTKWREN